MSQNNYINKSSNDSEGHDNGNHKVENEVRSYIRELAEGKLRDSSISS